MNFFSLFGDVEIINHTETEIRDIDLLVVPGGPDVDPSRYLKDEDLLNLETGKPCPVRERFDRVLLPKYIMNKTPVFGICRGHQSIATLFGGTLIQDMYHPSNPEGNRGKLMHKLRVVGKTIPSNTNIQVFSVNSIHHQVVSDDPIDYATVILREVSDKGNKLGYIEGLSYFPHYPIYTVQYHPEEIGDDFSVNLIKDLLNYEKTV
jgi:putative glutamine amidotransferase